MNRCQAIQHLLDEHSKEVYNFQFKPVTKGKTLLEEPIVDADEQLVLNYRQSCEVRDYLDKTVKIDTKWKVCGKRWSGKLHLTMGRDGASLRGKYNSGVSKSAGGIKVIEFTGK